MTNENKQKYLLPNGQKIFHHNAYETDFVFNEIFVNHSYFKHGITLAENAVIFDIGANIGLFSLYIMQHFPTSTIFAYEPLPEIYELLAKNMQKCSDQVFTYQAAISDSSGKQLFHYYPGYSVISGLHANKQRDAEIIISGMSATTGVAKTQIASLVNSRLDAMQTFEAIVTTISRTIKQNNIDKIDLLKIDVEGAELAVLQGIEKKDFPKIQQVAMEVHDKNDLQIIENLLLENQFIVFIDEDPILKESGIYNLFAIRR